MKPARFAPEQLRALYATAEGRVKWMGPDLQANGEVWCDTGSELLLSQPGADAMDAKPNLNRTLDRLADLLSHPSPA